MKKIRWIALLTALLIFLSVVSSCADGTDSIESFFESISEGESENASETSELEKRYLNGVSIDEYTIVYSPEDVDYSWRAATYVRDQIKLYTGHKLEVKIDTDDTYKHEIVIGETSRPISKELDADTEGLEFAILANDAHIAMEGDYFIIAAAAYFFIDTYINCDAIDVDVPKEVSIHQPIVKEAKNFILLIGDGMGVNQTRLYDIYDVETEGSGAYSDGEDFFYGYLLPYQGRSTTTSLSGTTDSAAGGTALSTGYKTYNGRVGRDKDKNDIQSLTELAGSKGMGTAVISTDSSTGATPSAFSAHANDRDDTDDIVASQDALKAQYGTIIDCGYNKYELMGIYTIEARINRALNKMCDNENGFFFMYEEAHIDKHSHNDNMDNTFKALVRFNQAIGTFMEFAFYNPDTFVLITADHETGGLTVDSNGNFAYTSGGNHTGAAVPIFAYGMGAEIFNDANVENVEIPKQIAALMGESEFGGPLHAYDYFW